jgi:hypothetical protein
MFHEEAAKIIHVLDDEDLFFVDFAQRSVQNGSVGELVVEIVSGYIGDFGNLVVFVDLQQIADVGVFVECEPHKGLFAVGDRNTYVVIG